jgi:cell division protein FtsQ
MAVRKHTPGREDSVGLLEPGQADESFRPKRTPATANIPDPVLEESTNTGPDEQFLRTRQRVAVRRRGGSRFFSRFGWLGGKDRWWRITVLVLVLAAAGLLTAGVLGTRSLLLHSRYFRLASTADIPVTGNRVVTVPQVLAVFAPDAGHSIFSVPLDRRRAQLEQIRWVRTATVMRLWPNRLRVNIVERTPIAFVRDGVTVRLVDDEGALLDLPDGAAQHYSFPVLTGISSADPLSLRAARIQIYRSFVQALDAEGGHISDKLSEVDLSDPEDVRAMFDGSGPQPVVHFGNSDYLPRYRAYQAHLAEWQQQYPHLRSVDLRYGRQVVLDTGAVSASAASSPAPAGTPPVNAGSTPPARQKPGHAAAARKSAAKPHAGSQKKKSVKERGHPVTRPLMHVVTGP